MNSKQDFAHNERLEIAAEWIRESHAAVAFTGAGISVESGIPSFRGSDGIWSRYDPSCLDIQYFYAHYAQSWAAIREIFYESFAEAQPNEAHFFLADLETAGMLEALITQNIDGLHHRAGSHSTIEYHGSARTMVCTLTGERIDAGHVNLEVLPPRSPAGGVWKPDFVFFGEQIPETARLQSERACAGADLLLIIGTTGEVFPAASLPLLAKRAGARIVEINPEASNYTESVSDIHIQAGAGAACLELRRLLDLPRFPH